MFGEAAAGVVGPADVDGGVIGVVERVDGGPLERASHGKAADSDGVGGGGCAVRPAGATTVAAEAGGGGGTGGTELAARAPARLVVPEQAGAASASEVG